MKANRNPSHITRATPTTTTPTPAQRWQRMTWKSQRQAITRHYRGTCCCYGPKGALLPKSKESGRNCIVSLLGPFAQFPTFHLPR